MILNAPLIQDICEAIDGPGPEWYRELQLEREDQMNASNLPASRPYAYQGTGRSLSPEEAAAEARRDGIRPTVPTVTPPKQLRGAVKVAGFPVKSTYPFEEIAADGGVWQLDSAEFKVKGPATIRAAASKWAQEHSLKAKAVIEGRMMFIQFRKAE